MPLKLISVSGKLLLQGEITLFDPLLSDYKLEDLADMLLETRTDWSELFPESEEFLNSAEFLSCLDDFDCDEVDSGQGGHVNFGYEESEEEGCVRIFNGGALRYVNLRFEYGEETDVEGGLWGYVNYRFDASSDSDSEVDLESCSELDGLLGEGLWTAASSIL